GVVAFTLGDVAYLGTGNKAGVGFVKDFWRYPDLSAPHLLSINPNGEGTWIDLGAGDMDNQNLSIAGTDLSIEDGNTVDLSGLVNDADADPTNELITGASLNGNDLEITDAGGTTNVNLSSIIPAEADPEVGANTLNYLPKWDGSALVQSTSVFEDATGNVGIGTDSPGQRLEVQGGHIALHRDYELCFLRDDGTDAGKIG
ncbi:MAG: hypothetical protein KDC84_16435, partial [Crocinitomicaceae bacterium]|nr:hypothetical protein [Crocinitomicaceae bacterium]